MRSSRENEQSSGKRRLTIFVDANTIVSGLAFEGNEALLLKLGAIGACDLKTTRYVIDEVDKALSGKEFGLARDEIAALISVVYNSVVVHESVGGAQLEKYLPRLDDEKDAHIWAAYEKLRCDMLVTGDKELLKKVTGAKTTRQTLERVIGKT